MKFLTKLLTIGILFSTVVRAVVVAKLETSNLSTLLFKLLKLVDTILN